MIDDHTSPFGDNGRRACFHHDMNEHWADDYAYIDTNPMIRAEHTYSDMLELLQQEQPENNPKIYRFVTVYVTADDGKLSVIGTLEQNGHQAVNLLAKAISLIAFHADLTTHDPAEKTGEFL